MSDETTGHETEPRHGMPSPKLSRQEFRRRYLEQFTDAGFDRIRPQLDEAADIAWDAYQAEKEEGGDVQAAERRRGRGRPDPGFTIPPMNWRSIG